MITDVLNMDGFQCRPTPTSMTSVSANVFTSVFSTKSFSSRHGSIVSLVDSFMQSSSSRARVWERSSLREQHECKLLIKCLMACYRAHPSQVAMLLDMTTVFLYPTAVDFYFLKVREPVRSIRQQLPEFMCLRLSFAWKRG